MNERQRRHLLLLRLLGSAVFSQALLSAASFIVGLVLIRRSSDAQYGAYLLAINAIALQVSLQNACCKPPLAAQLATLQGPARGALIDLLYRLQQRGVALLAALALLVIGVAWALQGLDADSAPLLIATVVAGVMTLHREYFRAVLFACRRPDPVLRIDALYVVALVGGIYLATRTAAPALAAVFAVGLASLGSGWGLSRALRRIEPMVAAASPESLDSISASTSAPSSGPSSDRAGELAAPTAPVAEVSFGLRSLRAFGPLAAWSTGGAAVHWAFSQGYLYLVAGTLDVAALAAIAATRLLLMPVNLMSAGIGTLMLPLASDWLARHGLEPLRRRMAALAAALALLALLYFGALWLGRDWVFDAVLHKHPPQRDLLLLLWGLIFGVTVLREPFACLLSAQGRYRVLTTLTCASATLALLAIWWGTTHLGVAGALMGLLLGELVQLTGIVLLSLRESQPQPPALTPA